MAVNGSIIYSIISLFMVSLGSSFYALINHSETSTELPHEFCAIQSLLAITNNQTENSFLYNGSTSVTCWIILSILLPGLVFILDGWHQRFNASWWSTWWTTWTFWSQFYNQHAPWMWHHVVGQTIAFGTTELLRFLILTPNNAFWQHCSPNITTTTPGCQSNTSSLPLLVSGLCFNSMDEYQSLETNIVTFLLQNLHSMPNLYLVSFGCATFIFLYVFYIHPLRLKVPTGVLACIWLLYTSFFFFISLFFYHTDQASLFDILISFLYGLFLQGMLYLVMHKKQSMESSVMPSNINEPLQQQQQLLVSLPMVQFDDDKKNTVVYTH